MEKIKENFGKEFNIKVNYNRYRFLQILNIYKNFYLNNNVSSKEFVDFYGQMRTWEKIIYGKSFWIIFSTLCLFPQSKVDHLIMHLRFLIGQYTLTSAVEKGFSCKTIIHVIENYSQSND